MEEAYNPKRVKLQPQIEKDVSEQSIAIAHKHKGTNSTERNNSKENGKQRDQKSTIPQNPSKNESIQTKDSVKSDTEQSQQAMQRKKAITIVGDSILNGIKERGLSGQHHVRVRAHPGAASLDLADNIRPITS